MLLCQSSESVIKCLNFCQIVGPRGLPLFGSALFDLNYIQFFIVKPKVEIFLCRKTERQNKKLYQVILQDYFWSHTVVWMFKTQCWWNYCQPVLGVLVFLPKNFLDFWHFLPRSWQLIFARFARICKIFQDRGKKSIKIFGVLGKKTKTIQDLGKRTKKSFHQSNTKSIDILWGIILENSKKGAILAWAFMWTSTWLDQKEWSKIKMKENGGQNQTYWNENNGPNFLRQNVWFFRFFSGIQIKRFYVGKSLVQA